MNVFNKLGVGEDEQIEHKMLTVMQLRVHRRR